MHSSLSLLRCWFVRTWLLLPFISRETSLLPTTSVLQRAVMTMTDFQSSPRGKPIIDGDGNLSAIRIKNSGYVHLINLEVINDRAQSQPGVNEDRRYGIYIENSCSDGNTFDHFRISNITFRDMVPALPDQGNQGDRKGNHMKIRRCVGRNTKPSRIWDCTRIWRNSGPYSSYFSLFCHLCNITGGEPPFGDLFDVEWDTQGTNCKLNTGIPRPGTRIRPRGERMWEPAIFKPWMRWREFLRSMRCPGSWSPDYDRTLLFRDSLSSIF